MNLYPALQFDMGAWHYFVVKMSARELSEHVKFASEVYEDRTLDQAIQRVLNTSRVKKEIVSYLQKQPWRFFSSIVVAALGGKPEFYPVEIADNPMFALLANDERLNESFGVLKFDGTQDYYALDGQHRLAAIRTALDKDDPASSETPEDFRNDEFSVLIVVPNVDDTEGSFRQKYRRLFSNLNRYAKPMDQATNIIMDEDDLFAIVTRRLISEHEFFRWEGRHRDSPRVKTNKGKNLRSTDGYFTSIETLYELNEILLSARHRENKGWPLDEENVDVKQFKRFRPDDDVIEQLYEELHLYWDAILDEVPRLRAEPETMRDHDVLTRDDDDEQSENEDNLLFWPIGQTLFAELVRDALDRRQPDPSNPSRKSVQAALDGVAGLEWRLTEAPWRHFLLVPEEREQGQVWKMRSEDRKACVRIGLRLQLWLLGVDQLDTAEVNDLRAAWATRLVPFSNELAEELWDQATAQRVK